MTKLRTPVSTLALILGASGLALAQGTSSSPGMGTGSNGAPQPSTSGSHGELDLPIERPQPPHPNAPQVPGLEPGDPELTGDPSDEPGDGDDPSDEPPPTFYGEEIQSETDTIFYVIDRSGSMQHDTQSYVGMEGEVRTGNKMARAKAELTRSITGLSENFEFNIISYNCGTSMWQPQRQEASEANKQSAIAWVGGLQAGGRTGTGPATSLALGDKDNSSIVLLTDGAPNCGADGLDGHRTMIASNNTHGATINVFGISATGSYRNFCQNVASDSGGSYFDVP